MKYNYSFTYSLLESTILGNGGVGDEISSSILVNSPIVELTNSKSISNTFQIEPTQNLVLDLLEQGMTKVINIVFFSTELIKLDLDIIVNAITTKENQIIAKSALLDLYDSTTSSVVVPSSYELTIENLSSQTASVKLAVYSI
jgi:hypothetical protein